MNSNRAISATSRGSAPLPWRNALTNACAADCWNWPTRPSTGPRNTTVENRARSFHGDETAACAYAARARLHGAFGQPEKALTDFAKAIELEPKNIKLWAGHACFHGEQAKWDQAVADLSQAVDLKPEQANVWYQRALVRVAAGQAEEYRKDCGQMLQRFGQSDKPDDAYWVAWTCALAPDATSDWPKAITLAEKAAKSDPKSAAVPEHPGRGPVPRRAVRRGGKAEGSGGVGHRPRQEPEVIARLYLVLPGHGPAPLAASRGRQDMVRQGGGQTDKALREHKQGIAEASLAPPFDAEAAPR